MVILGTMIHGTMTTSSKKDYLSILGLSPDLDDKELKKAFRREARKWHPDLNKNEIIDLDKSNIVKSNNSLIETDFIIAGIGSTPTVKLFENTNLKLDNGIVTNQFCETSIKDVYAAGDVSNFYHPLYERNIHPLFLQL